MTCLSELLLYSPLHLIRWQCPSKKYPHLSKGTGTVSYSLQMNRWLKGNTNKTKNPPLLCACRLRLHIAFPRTLECVLCYPDGSVCSVYLKVLVLWGKSITDVKKYCYSSWVLFNLHNVQPCIAHVDLSDLFLMKVLLLSVYLSQVCCFGYFFPSYENNLI